MQFLVDRRFIWSGLLAAALLAAPALFVLRTAHAAPASAAAARSSATSNEQPGTTSGDQVDLAVTVYNSNLALVRDVRQINLPTGEFRLRFMDIAASINPATVHFRSLSEPARLGVLERTWDSDLPEPQKLLQKYLGREVTLVRARQESATTKWDEVKATLLSNNNGPVWKIGNEIVTGMNADHIRFPELPENLYSRPTLLWELENKGAQRHKVEASYLATNLSWSADYVLTVGRDDKSADLDGWVTLVNNSGAAFKNAKLQLVAGDLHRLREEYARDAVAAKAMVMRAPEAPQFAQEAFSEYRLYALGRRTSIFDKESKQIHFKKLSDRLDAMEFEIALRNHKETPITVEVNEPIGGDWQMLESTHKWTKTEAWAAQFNVPVSKNGTPVLKYRIRARW